MIKIIDSGPGIPENELSNVLEPFYRLSKARESAQGGFGLGLAIVKNIIESHGGEFRLENQQFLLDLGSGYEFQLGI